MTYRINKYANFNAVSNPSLQTISTSYTEVTGSKTNVSTIGTTGNIIYRFSFLVQQTGSDQAFLHVKLQKSNDNFNSNIVDVPGCSLNFSGDTQQSNDTFYKICDPFFIVQNFDSQSLRLVARSYSSDHDADLHRLVYWDGQATSTEYYNPTLMVLEI